MKRFNNNEHKSLNESVQSMNEQEEWPDSYGRPTRLYGPKRVPTPGRPTRTSGGQWFKKKPNGTYDVAPDWLWDGSVGSSWIQIILNTALTIPGGPGDMTESANNLNEGFPEDLIDQQPEWMREHLWTLYHILMFFDSPVDYVAKKIREAIEWFEEHSVPDDKEEDDDGDGSGGGKQISPSSPTHPLNRPTL